MLRRDRQIRVQVYQFVDSGIFALSLWLSHWIRHSAALIWPQIDQIAPFSTDYFWLFLVVIPMTPMILDWQGYYERPVFTPVRQVAWQLVRACSICAIGLILIEFMVRRERDAARSVFVLFGACSFGLMMLKEQLIRVAFKTKLGQAQFKRRIMLLGAGEDTRRLRKELGGRLDELEIVGDYDLNEIPLSELICYLHDHAVNTVVIAARHTYFGKVEKAIHACEVEGVETWLLADFFETQISRTTLDDFYGRPVMVFASGPENPWPQLVKQLIDFIGAFVGLIIFAPFMLLAAAIIKCTSPGPVFFRQQRAGLNGKPFVMYKFRSMVSNAEQLKQEIEQLNEMTGPVFKVTNDPRVTSFGRLLRKSSFDEFPQLINVLRFEMSLVGPRPLPVYEVKRFDDLSHRRRLSVRPGCTCTWQVSGRNDVTDFKEWVRMDLEYIDNWSLRLDLKILWRTIWVVLLGRGAK